MIVCPRCNHHNPESTTSCIACGASLAGFVYRACPACGALNPAENLFCDRCLTQLVPDGSGEAEAPAEASVAPFVPTRPHIEAEEMPERRAARPEPHLADEARRPTAAVSHTTGAPAEPAQEAGRQAPMTGAPTQQTDREAGGPRPSAAVAPAGRAPLPPARPTPTPEELPDPLEGLVGLLPVEEAVLAPHHPTPAMAGEADALQRDEAELFRRMAATGAPLRAAVRVVLPGQRRLLPPVGRALLYLAVLLAALVPFFSPGLTMSWVQARPAVSGLVQTVEDLPAGATVLVSFDYGPAYSGELDTLALALARHLARRSVRVIAMSTSAPGLGLAEQVYGVVAQETPDYRYGEDYLIVGPLTGEEAGLRTLRAGFEAAFAVDQLQHKPLSDWPLMQTVATLNDVQRVFVLADDDQSVRRWIEQVKGATGAPLAALVSAAAEPLLLPYRQSGQLSDLIAGVAGAAEYETASGTAPYALRMLDGYALLVALVVLVAIVTNVVYIIRGERGDAGQAR